MTAFVSYFWSFVQWDIWIAFEDRKFLCQAEVTFTWTTFVFWRARLYIPFYWKNGALVFEVPNVLGESCAVLVRCLVEALRVVHETLFERRFKPTNVLFYCIITGLYCCFLDDSFLLTLSIEGAVALVSTVAHLWCGIMVWLQDGLVVAWDNWFHVCWTAVAKLNCVPVEDLAESVTLWEVLFDQG